MTAAALVGARSIAIARGALDDIRAHARRSPHRECCGLLIGSRAAGILRAWPATNEAGQDTRYLIRPADHFEALRDARGSRLEVLGAYHSHPSSEAIPSDRDRDEAFSGFLYVIAGPVGPEALPVSAWEFEAGNFLPIGLVPVE